MSVDFEAVGRAARAAFEKSMDVLDSFRCKENAVISDEEAGRAAVAAYLAQGVCTVTVDGMAYCESRCIFACQGCGSCSRGWSKNGIPGPSCPATKKEG